MFAAIRRASSFGRSFANDRLGSYAFLVRPEPSVKSSARALLEVGRNAALSAAEKTLSQSDRTGAMVSSSDRSMPVIGSTPARCCEGKWIHGAYGGQGKAVAVDPRRLCCQRAFAKKSASDNLSTFAAIRRPALGTETPSLNSRTKEMEVFIANAKPQCRRPVIEN